MAQKYFCEYCGKTFHGPTGAGECTRLPVCRGMNFPPKEIEGEFKIRACAIILARTAGDMLQKSPAGRSCPQTIEMGDRIKNWSDRAYKALEANTPISLGRATKVHRGLARFVETNLWTNKKGIPNLYLLEIAIMYVKSAIKHIEDRIDDEQHRTFWFEEKHSDWLFFDAVCMPLAVHMTKLKERRQISKQLDAQIDEFGRKGLSSWVNTKTAMAQMLAECYLDELRSWRFLQGALERAAKHIREHGTAASVDLSQFDPKEAYRTLFDYIWADEVAPPPPAPKKLRIWFVGDRFWVAAENKRQALDILTRETGHVAKQAKAMDPRKKLYDKDNNDAGTVGDMLNNITEAQFIGVE